ncbi:hypothetical protein [Rubinisphaera brasiliensis]|uniref:Uncharacterized protein n=1 Tax=Rubinisphaera brasiliensis (strain ATCC 49424 / DSM 5305 / JCM 21570 / IAM 15109 / NBRC 103401 / IFAM 1448) TaxID=756272 RepID=F0SPQ3_RUBBR|nr:hypothetical protein [Rubinisphaera brasiliensis]ADY59012.1 hypothetical protein Plabr_1400 [Rubinisphaera brasiliensis DSM 5305]
MEPFPERVTISDPLVRYQFSDAERFDRFNESLVNSGVACLHGGLMVQLRHCVERERADDIEAALTAAFEAWQFIHCTDERYAWQYISALRSHGRPYAIIFYSDETVLILEQGNNPEDWGLPLEPSSDR